MKGSYAFMNAGRKDPPPVISLTRCRAAYAGPGLALAPHKNAVAVLAVALERPFSLRLWDVSSPAHAQACQTALIAPGTQHHLIAAGPMAFLYLDAVSDDYAACAEADLQAAYADLCAAAHMATPGLADRLATALGLPLARKSDIRILTIVREMDRRPQVFDRVGQAAQQSGLSVSRFQALFRQETGLPFRRYRQWRRMAQVIAQMAAGDSLTRAAHAAGFASSAHLSTAFKTMFGLTPSDLLALGARFDIAPSDS